MQNIKFINKDTSNPIFFSTLRSRVEDYFRENNISKHYNAEMVLKTILLLSGYILPFVLILLFKFPQPINYLLWLFMGFSKSGIGMSIMHDANHGSYSKSRKVNYWLGHTLNMVGGSVFNWKLQHNILHHTYTNIIHMDDDIEDKLVLRFSNHTQAKWYHKFQFVYAFLFYGILTIYWALIKDFVLYRKYIITGVNKQSKRENLGTLWKIILSKIIYLSVFLFIPIMFFDVQPIHHILGFLLMHFVAGILLTIIFQLAHTVENTSQPLPNNEGNIENNW
ncbi:MAG: fatty acid desaturase, partial [Bacteroidia bacterium]